MLVQKQAPQRLRKLLIGGGAALLLLAGYVSYVNFFSGEAPVDTLQTPTKKTVPKDFGQDLFSDSRFYALVPKVGTQLITQASASRPAETLLAPVSLQGFNMQTGNAILLTWERPKDEKQATLVRVNQVLGADNRKNLATLPPTATTFVYRQPALGLPTAYEVAYIQQSIVQESPSTPAVAGSVSGLVTVTRADNSGVTLQYSKPGDAFESVEVYRSSTVGELGARIARLGTEGSTFEDVEGRGGLHFYTLRWVSETVSGVPATVTVAATDTTPPNPPDAVRVSTSTTNETTSLRVTWEPSSSADVVEYRVFRSFQELTLGSQISSKIVKDVAQLEDVAPQASPNDCAKSLCVDDVEVPAGSTAYYTVVAVDAAGNRSTTQDLAVSGRPNPFIPL